MHEEIMLLVQIIPCNIQSFAESLEVYDFPFAQETEGSQNSRVFRQVDEIFISAPCFLFCSQILALLNCVLEVVSLIPSISPISLWE